MINVYVTLIGIPAQGSASKAVKPVTQETWPPMAVEVPEGATVRMLMERMRQMGASTEKIQLALVNGTQVGDDAVLNDNDAVALIGHAGGD